MCGCCGLCALPIGALHAQQGPDFDRPGLGFASSVLPAAGLALEQGLPSWQRSHQDGGSSSQYTADSLLRLGLGHAWELQLGGSLYNRQRDATTDAIDLSCGHGDSSIGLKWAPAVGSDRWHWGVLGNIEFNDGARDIAETRRVYSLEFQLDQTLGQDDSLGYFAEYQREQGHGSALLAANYNHDLSDRLGVYVELGAQHQQDLGSGSVGGAGLTWQPLRHLHLQLDSYVRHRLSGRADEWEAGLGLSYYFGRL